MTRRCNRSLKVGNDSEGQLGNGNNFLSLSDSAFGGNLSVSAGGGNDTVSLTASTVAGKQKYGLGGGANVSP